MSQIGASTIANTSPEIIDVRQLTFFDEMETRNAEYAEKSDWTLKIYSEGYEYLLDVIDLCHEHPVSPDASSLRGDVMDTHMLWHRQEASP